jgi:urease accessory protein
MLIVREILGSVNEPRYRTRSQEKVWIAAADAGRRRLRLKREENEDVAVDLEKAGWLADGAVLHDDGRCILVVARLAEPVLVISLPESDPLAAFRIGHALGNRHAPVEVRGSEIIVPVTETPELAMRPLLAQGIDVSRIRFTEQPFAADHPPMCAGAGHGHTESSHIHSHRAAS